MPTLFNPNKKKGVFMVPAGATKSPTTTPSFTNTKSLAFDGVDEYVNLGNPTYLQSSSTASISLWVKFADVTTAGYTNLLTVGNSGTRLLFMRINPYNTVRRIEFGVLSSFARATSTDFSDLSSGVWYHIMGFYNRDLNDGTDCEIWLNGSKIYDIDVTTTLPATITENMYIADEGIWSPLDGNLDEVAVWNTDERVNASAIYNGGVPSNLNDLSTPPNQWYRCGDNSTYQTPQILMPENTNKDKVSNWSLEFDGVDDYIDCGDSDDFSFGNGTTDSPFSVSAWVYFNSVSGTIGIISKYGSSSSVQEWMLYFSSSNIRFLIKDASSGKSCYATGSTTLLTGQWYNFIGTYNGVGGGTAGNGIKIYLNGVEETLTVTNRAAYVSMENTAQPFEIGRYSTSYIQGNIDEVAIFNNELTSDNVNDIYNSGTPTDLSSYSNLLGWWRCGDGDTYPTLRDNSTNSNDGTMTNMEAGDIVNDTP